MSLCCKSHGFGAVTSINLFVILLAVASAGWWSERQIEPPSFVDAQREKRNAVDADQPLSHLVSFAAVLQDKLEPWTEYAVRLKQSISAWGQVVLFTILFLGASYGLISLICPQIKREVQYRFFPNKLQKMASKKGLNAHSFKLLVEDFGITDKHEILLVKEDVELKIEDLGGSLPAVQIQKFKRWLQELRKEDENKIEFRVVVAGQTSDGKSTLINNLIQQKLDYAEAGANVRGTTKQVVKYEVHADWVPNAMRLLLYDIPGYGDSDRSPVQVLKELNEMQTESNNEQAYTFKPGKMGINYDKHGIVTKVEKGAPADDMGIKAGAKIVKFALDGAEEQTYSQIALANAETGTSGYRVRFLVSEPFDALLLCAKASDAALQIGPMLVGDTVRIAFQGHNKWNCVAWVGTHGDHCDDTRKKSFVNEKLALFNEKIAGGILPENACVIDCQPIHDNTRSPNLEPLRTIIKNLFDKKTKGQVHGMNAVVNQTDETDERLRYLGHVSADTANLGHVSADAATEKEMLQKNAERLGTSVSEVTKEWERKVQEEEKKNAELLRQQEKLRERDMQREREKVAHERLVDQREQETKAILEQQRKQIEVERQDNENKRRLEELAQKRKLEEDEKKFREDCDKELLEIKNRDEAARQAHADQMQRLHEEMNEAKRLVENERERTEAEYKQKNKELADRLAAMEKLGAPLANERCVLVKVDPAKSILDLFGKTDSPHTHTQYTEGIIRGNELTDSGCYSYKVRLATGDIKSLTREQLVLFEDLEEIDCKVLQSTSKKCKTIESPHALYATRFQNVVLENVRGLTPFEVTVKPDKHEVIVSRRPTEKSDSIHWKKPIVVKIWVSRKIDLIEEETSQEKQGRSDAKRKVEGDLGTPESKRQKGHASTAECQALDLTREDMGSPESKRQKKEEEDAA